MNPSSLTQNSLHSAGRLPPAALLLSPLAGAGVRLTLNTQTLAPLAPADDLPRGTAGRTRRPQLRRSVLRTEGEPDLEWLWQPTASRRRRPPILMIHGAYADAWCWAHTFFPFFTERGHDVHAISLRRHGASVGASRLDLYGLADYVRDVERALAMIGEPCIVFGSSLGGLLAQRLLVEDVGAPVAIVLVNSVPPTGMLTAATSMMMGQPRFFAELLHVALSGKPNLKFLKLIANRPLAEAAISDLFAHVGRESARVLWEMNWTPLPAGAALLPPAMPQPPMFAFHGGADRMVPVSSIDAIRSRWTVDVHIAEKIGHVPMIERDWRQVATVIGDWLIERLPDARAAAGARSRPSDRRPSDGRPAERRPADTIRA